MNFLKKEKELKYIIDHTEPNADLMIANYINHFASIHRYEHWVVVCVGTDRSIGDSLGPLVGTKLKLYEAPGLTVLGTLDEPVHALNLQQTIDYIKEKHPRSGIFAIDASLGQLSSVGTIQIMDGPLKPGAGVKKELPEIGDFHLTGIVNIGGFMEYFVLQNTRLSLVMRMSELIFTSLTKTNLFYNTKKENA